MKIIILGLIVLAWTMGAAHADDNNTGKLRAWTMNAISAARAAGKSPRLHVEEDFAELEKHPWRPTGTPHGDHWSIFEAGKLRVLRECETDRKTDPTEIRCRMIEAGI